jgi:hypothetical protein
MARKPGRLEQDREFARRNRLRLLAPRQRPLGQTHRRHPHQIAGLHPGVGLGTTLVDPHLARADDAVDMGFGNPLSSAQQEVVETLPGGLGVDGECLTWRTPGGG